MNGRRELAKAAAVAKAAVVIALFALMIYYAYFLSVHISLDDVRNVAPGPIRDEIDRAISRLPPDQQANLDLPLPEVKHYGDTYLGTAVVIPGEMDAMPWILNNTGRSDKFVADIFGAEIIMGMTTRISTEGGDWANAPDPIRMMSDTNDIYKTDSPENASRLAKALNATLVYLPHRELNTGWWLPVSDINTSKFENESFFRKVYDTDSVTIYRII